MTIKKAVQSVLLGGAVAAMLGIGLANTPAQAQTPDDQRLRAQAYAKERRDEAAAQRSGHFNAAYWKAEHQRLHNDWIQKDARDTRTAGSDEQSEENLRAKDYAEERRQEAAAQRRGHFNAAYWKAEHQRLHDKWVNILHK